RREHAEEVEGPRPRDREVRIERMRVDDGGHRVGGVVEAVDELEAERDQQRAAEKDERPDRWAVNGRQVGDQVDGGVEHPGCEQETEDQNPAPVWTGRELRVDRSLR